jgi:hypothetical protein
MAAPVSALETQELQQIERLGVAAALLLLVLMEL